VIELAEPPRQPRAGYVCVREVKSIEPLEQGTLRVSRWSATRQRRGDLSGFGISAAYDFHAPGEGKLRGRIRLLDESGAPVRLLVPRGEHDGTCEAVHQMVWPADRPESIFGSFSNYQLELPAGAHRIRYVFSAEFLPIDGEPQPVTVENDTATVSVNQPTTRWLRAGVSHISVAGKSSLFDEAPDLLWSLRFDSIGRTSAVRDDSFDARWTAKTRWLRVTDEGHLDLRVTDRDVQYDDHLANLDVKVSALVDAADSGELVIRSAGLTITIAVEHSETRPANAGCRPPG
jgi:hypothetical protein